MVGFALPQFGESVNDDLAQFAITAEQLGADSLWVADRLLAAVEPVALHPGMSGAMPTQYHAVADPLIALAVAAAVTSTVRLGASVLVGPWYPPVQLARQLTTLDVVSRGRLLPGFGIGWSPDEYLAAGAPFSKLGTQLDELLDALLAIWTTNPVEHQGHRWSIPRSFIDFKPVQRPHPPIGLGAFSGHGLRRVGERADCWLPVVWAQSGLDLDPLKAQRRLVDDAARAVGRDAIDISTHVRINVAPGTTVAAVADTVQLLADNGYRDTFVEFAFAVSGSDAALEWVEHLTARWLPQGGR
jgi:probable F420-dependent oxidoreductase